MSAAKATVIRGGERHSIPAADLVPGDIILIEEGDTVPADARVVQSAALQTQEAALTGESLPVAKDTLPVTGEAELGDWHNMVFSGTAVVYGHGRAVVTATGMQTQMGRIAGLLKKAPQEVTPLQKELDRVGKILAVTVMIIAAVMIGMILLVSDIHGASEFFDVLILGVALAVAAVPEGLPAVVTAVLALGVQRMARRNAIVRKLAAVETLGSASVIASDKTGTLTKNEMTVRRIVTASGCTTLAGTGYAPIGEMQFECADDDALRQELRRALRAADRANNAVLRESDGRWTVEGDPTEELDRCGTQGRTGSGRAGCAVHPGRGGSVFVGTQADDHRPCDAEKGERLIALRKARRRAADPCSHELVGSEARPLSDPAGEILASNEALAADALRTLAVAFRRCRSKPRTAMPLTKASREISSSWG